MIISNTYTLASTFTTEFEQVSGRFDYQPCHLGQACTPLLKLTPTFTILSQLLLTRAKSMSSPQLVNCYELYDGWLFDQFVNLVTVSNQYQLQTVVDEYCMSHQHHVMIYITMTDKSNPVPTHIPHLC